MAARVFSLHAGPECPAWSQAARLGRPVVAFPDGRRAAVEPVASLLALRTGRLYVRVQTGGEDQPSRVTGAGCLRRVRYKGGGFWLDFDSQGAPWDNLPFDAPGYTWYAVAQWLTSFPTRA